MRLAISAIGVLLFAGLTAYDTQKIKSMYAYVAGTDMMGKTVIMGALSLYLDFINMFQFLLSFMGNRRLGATRQPTKRRARRSDRRAFFLSEIALEEADGALPRQVGGCLVVALGRRVVVEGVIGAVIDLE